MIHKVRTWTGILVIILFKPPFFIRLFIHVVIAIIIGYLLVKRVPGSQLAK